MKQVFVTNGKVVVKDVLPPVCGDNEVLVANAYSAISVGTETSAITGGKLSKVLKVLKDPTLRREAINYVKRRGVKESIGVAKDVMGGLTSLGYSSAGTVLKIGANIIDVEVGDRVACAGGGKANHADLVAVPRKLIVKIPDGVDFEEAAFTTLGAIAMQGIRRCGRQFGETLVILGVGLIGQLAVQIAKSAGYRVIAIDKISERVDLAKKMGADVGLVLGKHDLEKEVFHFTNGFGADAAIICVATSSSKPVNQAMKIPVDNTSVVANDNMVATIKWMDGSLTTLIYTALGHRDLAKERIEFFADGSSIILNDFKKLELYGFKKSLFGLKQTLHHRHAEP